MEQNRQHFDPLFGSGLHYPVTEPEYEPLVFKLMELEVGINSILAGQGSLNEQDLNALVQLIPEVVDCAEGGARLGFILMKLELWMPARELFQNLLTAHGEKVPFLYYLAVTEMHLQRYDFALPCLLKIIDKGERIFEVFLEAANCQYLLGDFRESIAMANLAVYENKNELPDPHVLLAKNFHATSEIGKMLECFKIIEKIGGTAALEKMGSLYQAHENMYSNLKKVSGSTS